ncbi:MAG: PepSY domain-containing protein [Nitrospira sp.]|nr:PepSY domain-containing protein [Nitrospira sp.]MDH4329366.1 PepSY domain-containing protein [Nitrospira sp.]MDH5251816.1 PepSY domain-containing protein [Nitrospira sp.]
MGKDDGRVVYKVEIVNGKKTHKVYVDAITGKVHETK